MRKHPIAQRAADILSWVREQPKHKKSGICSLMGDYHDKFSTMPDDCRLNAQAYQLIKDGMVKWPEGTGYSAYPVPGRVAPGAMSEGHKVLRAASQEFEDARDNGRSWRRNTRYGAARWRLLDWLQGVWLGEVTGVYHEDVSHFCSTRSNSAFLWYDEPNRRETMDNIEVPADLTKRKVYVLLSGVKIKWLSTWNEWKVTTPGGSTYHTTCREDAYYTAIALGVQAMDSVTA